MEFFMEDIALETTRRCNLRCEHCMRGESQNINMSPDIVDAVLGNSEIKGILHICFSGGEPTLNPNVIIYAINKIIEERIDVRSISMLTNGQIFNKELVEAFNRFNKYVNERNMEEDPPQMDDKESVESWIKHNIDGHARITFSTDNYHNPVPDEVKKLYEKYAEGIKIGEYEVKENEILETGLSTTGKKFEYKIEPIWYSNIDGNGDYITVFDHLYITANGDITNLGMGQYIDMDKINFGNVADTSIRELLANHGRPILDCPKIESESITIKK